MNVLALDTHRLGVRLDARITPRASRNSIDGIRDGRLVIKVTAPPVDDAANRAVVETVSEALGLPRRSVVIISGERSRQKSLVLSDITAAEVRHRLSAILGHSV